MRNYECECCGRLYGHREFCAVFLEELEQMQKNVEEMLERIDRGEKP